MVFLSVVNQLSITTAFAQWYRIKKRLKRIEITHTTHCNGAAVSGKWLTFAKNDPTLNENDPRLIQP